MDPDCRRSTVDCHVTKNDERCQWNDASTRMDTIPTRRKLAEVPTRSSPKRESRSRAMKGSFEVVFIMIGIHSHQQLGLDRTQ